MRCTGLDVISHQLGCRQVDAGDEHAVEPEVQTVAEHCVKQKLECRPLARIHFPGQALGIGQQKEGRALLFDVGSPAGVPNVPKLSFYFEFGVVLEMTDGRLPRQEHGWLGTPNGLHFFEEDNVENAICTINTKPNRGRKSRELISVQIPPHYHHIIVLHYPFTPKFKKYILTTF